MQGLKKYYIGLAILGLGTLALLVFVLMQGANYKNDKKTNESAANIALDLGEYISNNNKIPEQLDEATSEQIPATITYEKQSNEAYKFCVTYNSASGPSLSAESVLYQGLSGSYASPSSSYESDYKSSSLYISDYSWQKGQECYEIEPNIRKANSNSLFQNRNYDYLCDPDYKNADLYVSYCQDGKYQP